uniref:YolD n=1 Tax=Bacillus subtilis TaxID=1423 RepID=O30475_BACIU|nr:YolD [Bacillus subtilis subsp. subtilis str. 168]
MFQEESKWLKKHLLLFSFFCHSFSRAFAACESNRTDYVRPAVFPLLAAAVDYCYAVMLVWHLSDAKKRWRT